MTWRLVGILVAVSVGMMCNVFYWLALVNRVPGEDSWFATSSYSLLRDPRDFTLAGQRYRRWCIRCFTMTAIIAVVLWGTA